MKKLIGLIFVLLVCSFSLAFILSFLFTFYRLDNNLQSNMVEDTQPDYLYRLAAISPVDLPLEPLDCFQPVVNELHSYLNPDDYFYFRKATIIKVGFDRYNYINQFWLQFGDGSLAILPTSSKNKDKNSTRQDVTNFDNLEIMVDPTMFGGSYWTTSKEEYQKRILELRRDLEVEYAYEAMQSVGEELELEE